MKKSILIATIAILLSSCAREPQDVRDGMEIATYREWIKVNAPDATEISENVFVKVIEQAASPLTADFIEDQSWFTIRYTGRQLFDNKVFVTRSEEISHTVGKWTKSTHWCDDMIKYSYNQAREIPEGAYQILSKHTPGDSIRVYMPTNLAFLSKDGIFNKGLLGEVTDFTNRPIIFDFRIRSIINKPENRELDIVKEYAKEEWGILAKDSIIEGVYWRRTLESNDAQDIISQADSTFKIEMDNHFADGFMYNTTSKKKASEAEIYNKAIDDNKEYAPIILNIKQGHNYSESLKRVLSKVLREGKFRHTEKGEFIVVSKWSETGNAGNKQSIPEVLPYSPKLYKFEVLEKEEE